MLTIIIPVITGMTTVAYNHHSPTINNHHPPTVIGAQDSGVSAVMISVIQAHDPGVPAMTVFPIVIPILTTKRKGRTG